ncbi:MAG: hypothetical protein A3F33_01685 [Candidatus Woykebacteria bacterium RIFCSPHIGHO2_12_FULL_43_10]|uniref:Rieske domain-containing protein n=2 Tax=Candidatus Woykeibacteriota TaxID=1817899 RepID=A0A1G1WV44_9BACT|nr:MAG: hypothetical protein A2802_02345 [Candidatus Woykebacteria bacterium RIFCSPHIGHO2_01_FULL_43_29]OGY29525.1 MAG: hypothetical protein A3F33_01685 [Candidatus Woykebacteria bacterium RIFCSPHIGHO2_12_FULL_43_10]OGY29624.1 MAG: hypothetical protein A3J50_00225 [Candidatus Woykebacteria bacterium RIFCSPHIGHO2_02_FULL_43_16b]OGY31639.1 MAG: hypothetical protein A3A61_00415 [Candidatus Woykebacteria bacterium RIFCSPLOWO2_01_FULL_43_14]
MAFIKTIKESELNKGQTKKVLVQDREIALANVNGQIIAFDDTCTHEYCSLSDGELSEFKITCPCHGSQFDIRSGEVLNLPASIPVQTYETKVEDGEVFINV